MEQWRDIDGFEGMYQISDCGRVRSVERVVKMTRYGKEHDMHHKGRVLRTHTTKDGYTSVQLTKGSKPHTLRVHRLVAKAFIPNSDRLPDVNHKDGDKSNNKKNNLEWCTKSYNTKHAYDNGLIDKSKMKFNRKKVRRSDGKVFESLTEAAEDSGTHISDVSMCCHGRLLHTAGYGFEFV